nr:uncharacterized protein LOC116770883 [Danaus plexippus plexippus]
MNVHRSVQTLNILGVFPASIKSHFFVFEPFLKELVNRGHNLTVISYYPQKEPLKNYNDIDLSQNAQALELSHPITDSLFMTVMSMTVGHIVVAPLSCRIMLDDENVQNLWESETRFDLVIVEQFNSDCALALAHRLKAPVIGISSHMILPWHYDRYGIIYNPSFSLFDFMEGGTKPTFLQRLKRSFLYHYVNIVNRYITQRLEYSIVQEYFGNLPPLHELGSDIKLILVYQNFIFTGSSILPPNIIEVGGYHVKKPKELSGELLKFIEDSEHGVIYISFGTILKPSSIKPEKLKSIIEALEELPQRVVWKWNKRTLPGNPKNIYLSKWLPQNDILAHPKTVAFFSHCGLLGTTEAISHGVPIIGLPIFGDQPANAAAIEESGLGVKITLNLLNKDNLLKKLRTVLHSEFRENVKRVSAMWHDRPIRAMDSAIFWTEYAAKYQNISLRPPIVDVPLYQYLCLDIIFTFTCFLIFFILFIKFSVLFLMFPFSNQTYNKKLNNDIIIAKYARLLLVNMSLYRLCVCFLLIWQSVIALNILAIYPYHGKSHFIVFKVYLQELARRGHNVTVISHFPEVNPSKNYHDISLAGSMQEMEDRLPFHRSYLTVLATALYLTKFGTDNCKVMLENERVRNLIKDKPKFDVIVLEQFNSDCALGIAYKLGAPVVGTTSHVLMPWHYNRLGIPNNPSYVSFHFLEGGTKPTLFQRIERFIFNLYFNTVYYYTSQRVDQQTLANYYDDIPPLEDLGRQMKFLMLYHNFILTGSRLFPANVIEIGGYHVKEAKPLTGDLLKFVEEAEHGVIYVSFGSVVKSSTMPADKLNAVLEAMTELPQRFIWKWETDVVLLDKKKLYISSWLPQVDILGNPKTLAFLSHSGMGGTTEAIHFGVPVVAMPVVGDQPSNAAAVEESGLGVTLQIRDLTKENLLAAFRKVLDPKFRENVKSISKAWHDRPLSPLDTAVYWTEFAARYPNQTFRTPAADVPYYQYYSLDLLIFVAILIISPILILKYFIALVFCRKPKTTLQSKEKNEKKNKKKSKRE